MINNASPLRTYQDKCSYCSLNLWISTAVWSASVIIESNYIIEGELFIV